MVFRSHLSSNGSTEITIQVTPLKTYVAIRDCTLKGQETNLPGVLFFFVWLQRTDLSKTFVSLTKTSKTLQKFFFKKDYLC